MNDDGQSNHSDVPDLSDCFLAILREPPDVKYSSVAEAMQLMKQMMENARKQKPRTVLSAEEATLLEAIDRHSPVQPADLEKVRSRLTRLTAFDLICFSEDMAKLAARTNRPELLISGLLGLVVDLDQHDYREVLTTMSVINDCASRLQINVDDEIRSLLPLATEDRRQTIEGFLHRSPEWRDLSHVGIVATGSGEDLDYASTYFPG